MADEPFCPGFSLHLFISAEFRLMAEVHSRDGKRGEVLESGKKTLRLVRMLQVGVWHGGICRTGSMKATQREMGVLTLLVR